MKTYIAFGGHIGDAELTAGLFLATKSLEGCKIVTVALTGGEKGNPANISQDDYRIQKEKEAAEFARMLNGEAIVFPYKDGELEYSEQVVIEVAEIIRKYQPIAIFTHWKNSMHKDHELTSRIVKEAQFYASIDYGTKVKGNRCYAPLYYLENWEEIRVRKGDIPGTLKASYAFGKPEGYEGSILL